MNRTGKLALTVLLTAIAWSSVVAAASAADRAFTPRFSANDTGNIALAANSLMTCPTTDSDCAGARSAPSSNTSSNSVLNNNDYTMAYVDVDSDATTFNSSSADLSLPPGSTVLFAGLYWGGDYSGSGSLAPPSASARNTMKLRLPGASSYTNVTASVVDESTLNPGRYAAFANVTSLVTSGGAGTYFGANVQAGRPDDHYAGWSLVVAYRNPAEPARNLTIFDGLKTIRPSDPPTTITVSGFRTPPTGAVNSNVGFITWEGDLGIVGDTASLNNQTLSDGQNPATNFFNSSIEPNTRNPSHSNNFGFDADIFQTSGILGNNATSATLRLTTNGDQYLPSALFFATELYAPRVTQEKLVTDLNGGETLPGDVLEYTINTTNLNQAGTDAATGVVLRDPIPNDTTYVPGSIRIDGTGRTDNAGDDVAEFDGPNNRIVARIGSGATSTAGGRLAPGASAEVTFRVTVGTPLPDDRLVKNRATASFFSETLGTPLTASSAADTPVGAPDLAIEKRRTSGAITGGQPVDYEIEVRNVGDAATVGQVTVSDTVPQGLTVNSVSGSGWTCTVTPPLPSRSFTCTRSNALAPSNSYPVISLRADTDPGLTGAVTNTASVGGGSDINFGNNSGSNTTAANREADVVVTKSASPQTIDVGDTSTFTIAVRNDGPSTASSVGLDDPMPPGLTQIGNATTTHGTCVAGLVVCDLGDLAPGVTATVTVTVRAESSAAGRTITNSATATSTGATDPNPGNNTDEADVTVTPVDLAIVKSMAPSPPSAGGPVSFTLTATNDGPSNGTGVVVRDQLPNSILTPTVTNDGGAQCSISSGELVCLIGNLAAGTSRQIVITGTVAPATTRIENTAAIAGAEIDPDPSNDTSTVEADLAAPPAQADLSVDKSASPATAARGDEVTYSITARNDGPDGASGVRITDQLPSGVSFVSSPDCTHAGGTVTCTIGALAPGQSRTVTVRVAVDPGAATGPITNTARVASDTTDPDPSDDTDTATFTVTPPTPTPGPGTNADLEIRKSANKADASPSELVTYTFTAKNNGPDTAHHVTVRDPLSPYLLFVSGDNGCAYANYEVVCDMGDLASGQSASKNIVLRLDPNYSPSSPPTAHDIDVQKVERFVSLQGGQYRQETLSCPSGYVMTDANPRVTGVDHGNDLADVHVVGSRTAPGNSATDVAEYRFEIENHTPGQAQVHLFGVCVELQARGNGGHSLGPASLQTDAIDQADLTGETRVSKAITCPNPNDVAIAPGYVFRTGANYVHGPSMESERSPDGRSWTFAFDVAPKSGTQNDVHIDLSVRCMPRTTTQNAGHGHALTFHHVYGRVAVGPHSTAEHRLSCPVGFKGVAETHDLPAGLRLLGTTPEPINRDFKLHNPTGQTLHANIDLVCLKTRIGDERNGGDVMNTAQVYGDEPDWNAGNDFSSWVLHDPPAPGGGNGGGSASGGGSTGSDPGDAQGSGQAQGASGPGSAAGATKLELRLGESVTRAGKRVMVPLFGGEEPSEGTLTLKAGANRLGQARFELDPNEDDFVEIKLSKKGRKLLRNRRFVTVTVESGGEVVQRVLRVAG